MAELVRYYVAHRVGERQRQDVGPANRHDALASTAPLHAERNQVGLREDNDDVPRDVGERAEEAVRRRSAPEYGLSLGGANHAIGDRVSADRGRVELNAPIEPAELAAPVSNRFARQRDSHVARVAEDGDSQRGPGGAVLQRCGINAAGLAVGLLMR